jgi:hypothetical protein
LEIFEKLGDKPHIDLAKKNLEDIREKRKQSPKE